MVLLEKSKTAVSFGRYYGVIRRCYVTKGVAIKKHNNEQQARCVGTDGVAHLADFFHSL